jgi:hypothetical protein
METKPGTAKSTEIAKELKESRATFRQQKKQKANCRYWHKVQREKEKFNDAVPSGLQIEAKMSFENFTNLLTSGLGLLLWL